MRSFRSCMCLGGCRVRSPGSGADGVWGVRDRRPPPPHLSTTHHHHNGPGYEGTRPVANFPRCPQGYLSAARRELRGERRANRGVNRSQRPLPPHPPDSALVDSHQPAAHPGDPPLAGGSQEDRTALRSGLAGQSGRQTVDTSHCSPLEAHANRGSAGQAHRTLWAGAQRKSGMGGIAVDTAFRPRECLRPRCGMVALSLIHPKRSSDGPQRKDRG